VPLLKCDDTTDEKLVSHAYMFNARNSFSPDLVQFPADRDEIFETAPSMRGYFQSTSDPVKRSRSLHFTCPAEITRCIRFLHLLTIRLLTLKKKKSNFPSVSKRVRSENEAVQTSDE
jgi:hypothetical protein